MSDASAISRSDGAKPAYDFIGMTDIDAHGLVEERGYFITNLTADA